MPSCAQDSSHPLRVEVRLVCGTIANSAIAGEAIASAVFEAVNGTHDVVLLDFNGVEVLTSSAAGALFGRLIDHDVHVLDDDSLTLRIQGCSAEIADTLFLVKERMRLRVAAS